MTTASWTNTIDQTSDAAFRVWVADLIAQMIAIGLVQTGDTGQINTATVTRAGVSTAAGYVVFRFADSTIYFKLEFGSGSSSSVPAMWITVGTGSNGSGTITGQSSSRSLISNGGSPASTVTNYPSYICRTADGFSLSWKETGFTNSPGAGVCIYKTVDGAGAPTTTGFAVYRQNTTSRSLQPVRTASTATTYNDSAFAVGIFPGDPTNSQVQSGNTQAYQIPINIPEVVPWVGAVACFIAEAPINTTFSVAMVGAVSHTYRSPGAISNQNYAGGYSSTTHTIAFIWE